MPLDFAAYPSNPSPSAFTMSRQIPYMESWLKPLQIEPVRLRLLAEQLSRTYKDLAFHSSDQFLATPITRLPTGAELGEYLAIDFGGSNVRIAFVNLLGSKQHTQSQEPWSSPRGDTYDEMVEKNHERSWPIEDHLKVENAEDLFAWVGGCLAEVVTAHFLHASHVPEEIPLGITFSFPMMYVRTSLLPCLSFGDLHVSRLSVLNLP